jgi:hypothetical protein
MGEMHSIGGKTVSERIFELSIPFQNKIGSDLLPDMLKGPKLSLAKIEVSPPFQLIEFSPKLPLDIGFMDKAIFKLKIKAPDVTYEGPLTINFGNESKEVIAMSIDKIMLTAKGRTVDLEDSSMTMGMQKGQLFKKSIQLYKVFSYGDTVNAIEVSKPFELINTEPKLPFRLDTKDSYIASIYIKAPDFSYAGSLEVSFK